MMNNYQKYFGTLERAAATLADLETENQYLISKHVTHDVAFEDLKDHPEELLERAVFFAIHPLLYTFESIEDGSPFIDKEKPATLKPTGVHHFIDWLNEEYKSNE